MSVIIFLVQAKIFFFAEIMCKQLIFCVRATTRVPVKCETKSNETKRNDVTFRFDRFRFVSFCLISFRFVRFRFVSFLFRFALYRYPSYAPTRFEKKYNSSWEIMTQLNKNVFSQILMRVTSLSSIQALVNIVI